MAKKILKTKTNISNKTVVGGIIITVIIAGSIIAASIISPQSIGNFYSGSGDINTNITLPTQGWCVTKLGFIGDNGDHMSKDSCLGRATDNNDATNWYAFCPDITGQGDRTESSCDCNATDITKSEALNNIIAMRDGLIGALNDGNISQTDMENQFKFMIATQIDCACGIYSAGNYDSSANDNDADTSADAARKLYTIYLGGKEVTGVHSFLRKAAKMFSKMHGSAPKCELLPDSCIVTSSYRDSGSHKYDDEFVPFSNWGNEDKSAHDTGQAIDIGCATPVVASGGCTGDAATAEGKIRGAASGLNVLRECNTTEKNSCGDGGKTQVIHVDEKTRGDDNPNVESCYYINCNFADCKSVTP